LKVSEYLEYFKSMFSLIKLYIIISIFYFIYTDDNFIFKKFKQQIYFKHLITNNKYILNISHKYIEAF